MSLIDKLRHEFIDIIEWTQPAGSGILAYRFPRADREIKMGAQLTVREGQAAVFVNEGQIADVLKPGLHTLTTRNLPVLAKLKGWKYGFESPYKAEVYFISTAQQTDHKWGTSNPVMLRDSDFGIVRLRGFGSYVFRVVDPALFVRELVATDPQFDDYEIDGQLRQVLVARFSDVLGKSGIPVLDLCGNYEKLAEFVHERVRGEFAGWGLDLVKFFIENLSLPPEVEQAVDRRTAIGAVGDLAKYTQFQAAEALRTAAAAPGGAGLAGAGVGLGAGLALAQQVASSLGGLHGPPAAAPPPLPGAVLYHVGVGGAATGPFDLAALAAQAERGALSGESLVWRAGLGGWIKAADAPELSGLFRAAPPPLPPP